MIMTRVFVSVGNTTTPCHEGWYHCPESLECIPGHWVCDREEDCGDKRDEQNCTYPCRQGELKCDENRCIPEQWVCDGRYDCVDRTDEPDNCSE